MNVSAEGPLLAFAVISQNWEEHGTSYIDNFLPMVAHCLHDSDASVASDEEIQRDLDIHFGLALPRSVIKTILKRAAREGLVKKRDGVYHTQAVELQRYDLTERRDRARGELAALVERLREFAAQEYELKIERADAEAGLLDFVGSRSIPILRSSLRKVPLETELVTAEQFGYVLSQFIAYLYERDPDGFRYLETVVKGSVLATALYLPDVGRVDQRIRNLDIYLDTPFILSLLGFGGTSASAAASELADLLVDLGGDLACFEHTLGETQRVVTSAVDQLRSLSRSTGDTTRMYPPLVEHCLEQRVSATQLEVRSARLREELADLGVRVTEAPEYKVETTVAESDLENVLQDFVGYRNENARLMDLRSLTAVYQLRRGKHTPSLDSAKAIFVTPNARLVAASGAFFRDSSHGEGVPVCALDHELATVAWLKKPARAPDLPKKQLIADCYAAGFPNDELWHRYLSEVDRIDSDGEFSDEDYFTLRFGLESRRALMQMTLGAAEAFTTGAVHEVLDRARREQQGEAYRRSAEAAAQAKEERRRAFEANERAEGAEQALEQATSTHREELAEISSLPTRRLQASANESARKIVRVLKVLFLLLMLVVTAAAAVLGAGGRPVPIIVAVGMTLIAVLSILNNYKGVTVERLLSLVEQWLAQKIFERRRRFIE